MLQREHQILVILWRDGGNPQFYAGQIDALVLAEKSAVDDLAQHGGRCGRKHMQFDQAVTQQDAVAARDVAGHALVGRAHALARPVDRTDRNRKALPGNQLHGLFVLQRARADFGPLKIGENPDRLGKPRGSFPQPLDRPRMIFMSSVRKIQARHVHPGAHQPHDHFGRVAGGSESAYNFSAAKIHGFCPNPFCLEGGLKTSSAYFVEAKSLTT